MIYRLGDPEAPPTDSSPRLALGAVFGIVPLLIVGLFFWAVLSPQNNNGLESTFKRHSKRK